MPSSNRFGIKALAFDVFGTVVDWRGSIICEGAQWGRAKNLSVDWAAFADRWRAGYMPTLNKVRTGALPWTKLDALHRSILDELLVEFKIPGLTETEKDHWNRVWHRLAPWPDAVEGLERMRPKYVLATLSNGNLSLLTNMAKFSRLPWDAILGGDLFRHYKPDREVYLGAVDLLSVRPEELMLVAAHPYDLEAAKSHGLSTALVPRPMEYGPEKAAAAPTSCAAADVTAKDFVELAEKLG